MSSVQGGSSAKKGPTHTVNEVEVHSLHQKLTYGEDAIEATHFSSDMDGPNYNMRTWAASTRKANLTGGGPSGSSRHSGISASGPGTNVTGMNSRDQAAAVAKANKMAKWDTSHVQEVEEEQSFLNTGPSAVLLTRKPPAIGPRERIQGMSSVVAAGSTTMSSRPLLGYYDESGAGGGESQSMTMTPQQQRYTMVTSMGGGPNQGAPVSSSQRMKDTIARFKPKAHGNVEALAQLQQDADDYVRTHCHAKLPFGVVPNSAKTYLDQDVLLPQRQLEAQIQESERLGVGIAAHLAMGGSACRALRHHDNAYQPRTNSGAHNYHSSVHAPAGAGLDSSQTMRSQQLLLSPHHRGSPSSLPQITGATPVGRIRESSTPTNMHHMIGVTHPRGESASTQLNPATAPVSQLLNLGLAGGLSPMKDMEPAVDVDLPVHQNVNYAELLREQSIVERDCKDHEQIYKSLLEDLDDHMSSVKVTFNAMLTGKFELKPEDEERKKKQSKATDSGVLSTNENFGSGGKNVAYILPSSPSFSRGTLVHM